jgi:NAD(P)-dependent dehydrogenase (short-subunit alcohol dehydrogenase family)
VTVDGFDLTGKRTLVVGTGSAIGLAIVDALVEAGARVASAHADHPPSVGAGLSPPVREAARSVDLTVPGAADGLVREVVDDLGGLDVVVNCGDLRLAAPFEELADAEWDRLIAVNLTVPVRLLRAAGRQMLAHGGGRLVQVVSLLGERGVANTAAYSACQAGLIQLIRALAIEWARRDVRVNGIGLGWFEGDPLLASSPQPDGLLRYLPTRRLGRPEEVGALAVYLASDASDMMTGQVIWVDGAILSHA